MALVPKINKQKKFHIKCCTVCGGNFGPDAFAPTKSFLYPEGAIPICDTCIDRLVNESEGDWAYVNKLCQMVDVPFVPAQWQSLYDANPVGCFHRYAEIFMGSEFDSLSWGDYFEEFKSLRAVGAIERELPEIGEAKRKEQRERWGANYDDDALDYLDGLYNGLMTTQNVNGALQMDQAIKLCKISYEIDKRIEEGAEFDKLLQSYDKLVKIAEFNPKNAKNINDFDTVGEVLKWMEKRGWRNQFYDRVSRDIVDETMKNFQNFNQRLYVNESGIGEDITRRIEALQAAKELERRADAVGAGSMASDDNYYGTDQSYDLDNFDNDGFTNLFKEDEEAEFNPGGGS